jgi:hypothetical protein
VDAVGGDGSWVKLRFEGEHISFGVYRKADGGAVLVDEDERTHTARTR